jgi:tetratricopeptide (TPR) repeat protein
MNPRLRARSVRPGLWLFLFAVVVGGCGAAPRGGARDVRANIEVMERERTADKLFERGRAFAAVGDHTRAEQYLSMALDAGADPAKVLPLLLRACVEGERYLVALQFARTELRRNPGDARLEFVVASLEAAVGDQKKALAELRALTAKDPDDAEAHFALAAIVRDGQGDPDEADLHFREYLRISPEGQHAGEARASLQKERP